VTTRLNLGCGPKRTQYPGYVNIDRDPALEPDAVIDFTASPYSLTKWGDGTVEEVRCENLFDSLEKKQGVWLIREIWRVLKTGGYFKFHQGDVAKNPDMCFGWPWFVSGWTRNDFRHYTIGEAAYESWKEPWNLPGFDDVDIVHNDSGIMLGSMRKPF